MALIRGGTLPVQASPLLLPLLALLLVFLLRVRGPVLLLVMPLPPALPLLLPGALGARAYSRGVQARGSGTRRGADDAEDRVGVHHVEVAGRILAEGTRCSQRPRPALGAVVARQRKAELDRAELGRAQIRVEVPAGDLRRLAAAIDVAADDRAAVGDIPAGVLVRVVEDGVDEAAATAAGAG